MTTTTISITVNVTYEMNGVAANEMAANLESAFVNAVGSGLLTGDTKAEVDSYEIKTAIKTQKSEANSQMSVSLDGGETWAEAKNGVRVIYHEADIPGEDDPGEFHVNLTSEGIIQDAWVTREDHLDHNIATSSILLVDALSNMLE